MSQTQAQKNKAKEDAKQRTKDQQAQRATELATPPASPPIGQADSGEGSVNRQGSVTDNPVVDETDKDGKVTEAHNPVTGQPASGERVGEDGDVVDPKPLGANDTVERQKRTLGRPGDYSDEDLEKHLDEDARCIFDILAKQLKLQLKEQGERINSLESRIKSLENEITELKKTTGTLVAAKKDSESLHGSIDNLGKI